MKKILPGIILVLLLSSWFVFLSLWFYDGSAFAVGDENRQSVEKRVIALVNSARLRGARCGNAYYAATRPLDWNETLSQAARKHSLDMASEESVGHTGSDGSGPGERIARLEYKWMTYGENVASGYLTPEEVVNEWLRNEGHCKNIMNPRFREAGAAYAKGTKKTYWTLVLAAPASSGYSRPRLQAEIRMSNNR